MSADRDGTDAAVDTDVLLVGAGPTGLTLAIELARRGIDHRLVERADGSVETSRAISIQPRTLQLFGDLGVLPAVLDEGTRVTGLTGYRDGEALFSLDADVVDAPYPYLWHLPQNRTERLLRDRLRDLGGDVEFRRELVGLGQGRDRVTATVRHRDADGEPVEEVTARWLVGTDGGSSRVRRSLGVPFEGVTQEERFLVADARVDWDRRDDRAGLWFHRDGLFVVFPMPGDRWRLFADVSSSPERHRPDASVDAFRRLLRERTGVDGAIRDADWTSEFTVNQRMAGAYRRGRALLAGDAAHVHVPLGGVGMNTGIQDAYNLGWKLALVVEGAAPEALLDTYAAERRPVAEDVLDSTGPSISFLTSETLPVRLVRDRVVATLLDAGPVQRPILRADTQLDVSYRDGPLTGVASGTPLAALVESPAPVAAARRTWRAPRAGDRVPDVDLAGPDGEETSVHREVRGPTFTLLAFAGTARASAAADAPFAGVRRATTAAGERLDARVVVPAAGEQPPAVAADGSLRTLRDPTGEAHRRYGATRPTLYLIRPDDYVGFRGRPARAEPALEYLRETVGLSTPAGKAVASPTG